MSLVRRLDVRLHINFVDFIWLFDFDVRLGFNVVWIETNYIIIDFIKHN